MMDGWMLHNDRRSFYRRYEQVREMSWGTDNERTNERGAAWGWICNERNGEARIDVSTRDGSDSRLTLNTSMRVNNPRGERRDG